MIEAVPATSVQRMTRKLGYRFQEPELLLRACTHRSFGAQNNERLEFLGDALIGCVIAADLYSRQPKADEGGLSRLRASLVCEKSLARLARGLDLAEILRLGEGERKSGGYRRDSILSDTLEAVFGAIYLDGGFEAACRACLHLFEPLLADLPDAASLKDAKTRLQEYLQARGLSLPDYAVLEQSGPAHRRHFHVACRLENGDQVEAEGSSRRAAEQDAAAGMLEQLGASDA